MEILPDIPDQHVYNPAPYHEHYSVILTKAKSLRPSARQVLQPNSPSDFYTARKHLLEEYREPRTASVCTLLACGLPFEVSLELLQNTGRRHGDGAAKFAMSTLELSGVTVEQTAPGEPRRYHTVYSELTDPTHSYTEQLPTSVVATAINHDNSAKRFAESLEAGAQPSGYDPQRLLDRIFRGAHIITHSLESHSVRGILLPKQAKPNTQPYRFKGYL